MTSGRLLLGFAVLGVALVQASASPLDADTCAKLKGEHAQLELAGVELNIAKGPKLNLTPDQLQQIRRYIELEEQLLFRCRDKNLISLAPEPDPPPTTDANDQDKGKATPKAVAPPPAEAKKGNAPSATQKKQVQPVKKAAVQPSNKGAATKTKEDPKGVKAKPAAKSAVKQPSGGGVPPPPADATAKRTPKAKVDAD